MEPTRGAETLNRLATQSSPYLRQHAANPVDWYPWGSEALERARTLQRPILLSIGYAACHWCHVMAHESFEDPATAAVMNELFVSIKVDREERPDLDRIYQLAHQMLTRRGGGWPLTMFLTHDDQRPFFGGTYFPPEPRHGLPGFASLLREVAAYYRTHGAELRENGAAIVAALGDLNPPAPATPPQLTAEPLRQCRSALEHNFDARFGGFGPAPKFPAPGSLLRLLRDWRASATASVPDLQALYMTTLTLTRMAEGGLMDQLAGGFCRYSVDAQWDIPHFEKMLYDNAQLLTVYAEAAQATGEPLFAEVAGRTADWMLAELGGPDGALYASIDADSEGHEGRFYVWEREAVRAALPAEQYAAFAARFGLDLAPNFEQRWYHLRVSASVEAIAAAEHLDAASVERRLREASAALLRERSTRVRPARDEKVLTSWNALAIAGLAVAARSLGRPELATAAGMALDNLRARHWQGGRLLATGASSGPPLKAYLDDHVFLIEAVLELQTVRFRAAELRFATELADAVLALFADAENGGFYFTGSDHEALISRPKSYSDDALPAGNGVAAYALQRLGYLLGESRYLAAAERAIQAAWPVLLRYPQAHCAMLRALEEQLSPPQIVILRGTPGQIEPWRQQLAAGYAPHQLVLAISSEESALPEALASKPARPGGATAYVCRGSVCSEPVTTLEGLASSLQPP